MRRVNGGRTGGKALWVGAFLLLMPLLLGLSLPTETAILLETEGRLLVALPGKEGAELTLAYEHSATRTPVRDVYQLRFPKGKEAFLLPLRTEQTSFGAGLPTETEGRFEQREGVYVLELTPDPIFAIPLRVGAFSDPHLTLESGTALRLLEGVSQGTLVTIRPGKVSRLTLYRRKEVP